VTLEALGVTVEDGDDEPSYPTFAGGGADARCGDRPTGAGTGRRRRGSGAESGSTLFRTRPSVRGMHSLRALGLGIALLALVGYVVGVVEPYPGRAVTVAGVMAGIALATLPRGGR
jgi:hypothetical protein